MPASSLFPGSRFPDLASVLRHMPALAGAPIRLERMPGLHDRRGPVHAGSYLRERRIAFDCTRAEFPRIFVHEVAHFIWLRLGNARRCAYEDLLASESGAGELGWSAEWRKLGLRTKDRESRTRRWREYCCESFCDTAAWFYSGLGQHPEFTLSERLRRRRAKWFSAALGRGPLSI